MRYAIVALFLALLPAHALTLLWDRNSETNVTGYRVHVGLVAGQYTLRNWDAGNTNRFEIPVGDIPLDKELHFAVTAYDSEGLESQFSADCRYDPGALNLHLTLNPVWLMQTNQSTNQPGFLITLTVRNMATHARVLEHKVFVAESDAEFITASVARTNSIRTPFVPIVTKARALVANITPPALVTNAPNPLPITAGSKEGKL